MRYIILLIISLCFLAFTPSFSQESPSIKIVYPDNNSKIYAASTFIIGSTTPKADLTINEKNVKVYENGGFVEVVKLNPGENNFKIESTLNNEKTQIHHTLQRETINKSLNYPKLSKFSKPILAEVSKDYAAVRNTPDGDRQTPLPKGTKILLTGKMDNSYRFKVGNNNVSWIDSNDIKLLTDEKLNLDNTIKSIKAYSDSENSFIKINMPEKLPVSINQILKPQMTLTIYGVNAINNILSYSYNDDFISEIKVIQPYKDIFKVIIIPKSDNFWGYSYYYEKNTLVLKLRKPLFVNPSNPLKDKIITLDPGHGGKELGSVGPTGIPEKDVNLNISKFLKEKLEEAGAKVIMTREKDEELDLYKRIEIANINNSQILLSIHNNALPDGKNPYIDHGSSTYYYHPQSLPLARAIQKSLVDTLGFKNYGVFNKSLALVRPNEPLAVLVEVGFMINPDEYNLLIQEDFQRKSADAIFKGLENFFLNN